MKQLSFEKTSGWGGKRPKAGRTNKTGTVNHMLRPKVTAKFPLHLTLKIKEGLPSIRKSFLLKEFKKSAKKAKSLGLYVLHFSIQQNHIHLFAEADGNNELALGMRSLAGRFAKIIRNYASKKGSDTKGSVFKGRYHIHILKTPQETRNALEYVLLNLSKHQKLIEHIDRFSSGGSFIHWRKLLGARFRSLIKSDAEFYENHRTMPEESLSLPKSWLARGGWMMTAG
jgi:REP element-mobilizing transposase RayT